MLRPFNGSNITFEFKMHSYQQANEMPIFKRYLAIAQNNNQTQIIKTKH